MSDYTAGFRKLVQLSVAVACPIRFLRSGALHLNVALDPRAEGEPTIQLLQSLGILKPGSDRIPVIPSDQSKIVLPTSSAILTGVEMTTPKCPKCSATMEEGFVLAGDNGAPRQASWIGGKPEPSFWTGLKLKDRPKLKITTFRCPKCGLLESYATDAVE